MSVAPAMAVLLGGDAPRGRGKWGPDNELGCLNFLEASDVLRGCGTPSPVRCSPRRSSAVCIAVADLAIGASFRPARQGSAGVPALVVAGSVRDAAVRIDGALFVSTGDQQEKESP
jgi:hypothetical protein